LLRALLGGLGGPVLEQDGLQRSWLSGAFALVGLEPLKAALHFLIALLDEMCRHNEAI